jgi:hypothetical protein
MEVGPILAQPAQGELDGIAGRCQKVAFDIILCVVKGPAKLIGPN